jgi:hypothetical protein
VLWDPDSITPRVALATGLLGYAWQARGHTFADEVTKDGWRLFHERVTEARRIPRRTNYLLPRWHGEPGEWGSLCDSKVQWPPTQRGFEALCRRYPKSVAAPSQYCDMSGLARARDVTQHLFARLGNRVDLSVWRTVERWEQARCWAFYIEPGGEPKRLLK